MNAPLIRFNRGDAVVIDNVWYKETRRTAISVTLDPIGGGVPRVFSGEELRDLYFDPGGRMRIVRKEIALLDGPIAEAVSRPFESFTAEQQAEMLKRLDYVNACDRFFARKLYSKRPEDGYAKIARIVARWRRLVRSSLDKCGPDEVRRDKVSGSALRNWYTRWRASGRLLGALAPLSHRRGRSESRLDPAVRAIIADSVRENWLTLEAPPLTITYDLICQRVAKLNEGRIGAQLVEPSEMAVRRWVKENVDPYMNTFFRKGRKEADHQSRLIRTAPVAVRPLQVVEFDETPLDIILVDRNGRPRGRAHLTAGICVATGMIVGWHIGFEKPSWTTVMQALRMAVLKKDTEGSGAESPYPVFGIPEMIKVDNGPAYRSTSLVAAAGQLQFELRLVPVGKPNLKGKVERFFREVSTDFLSVFPGRTFSNVQQRGDYDSEGNAAMTLEDAQRLFMRWVVDIYHNRPNSRCFGQTPLQRWEALAGCGVRLPSEAMDLAPLIGLIVNRTIQADGITFMGLTYRDEALRDFRRSGHLGQEWMVKVDPLDISALLVLDADGCRWVRVPCQQPHLIEGLTLKMWMDVVRQAREVTAHGQRVRRATLLRARENLIREAQAMGSRPRGKITAADYRWIEAEVGKPAYEIAIDPEDDGEHKQPVAKPRNRKTRPHATRQTGDPDPTTTAPASRAGGYPVAKQQLPDAGLTQAQCELSAETQENEEQERPSRFLEGSARAAGISDAPAETTSLAPNADDDAGADNNDTQRANAEPTSVTSSRDALGQLEAAEPTRLIDEDGDEHWDVKQGD